MTTKAQTDGGAFLRELDRETAAAARDALVDAYLWANRQTYGDDPADLRERADRWADSVIESGNTMTVLEAMARE